MKWILGVAALFGAGLLLLLRSGSASAAIAENPPVPTPSDNSLPDDMNTQSDANLIAFLAVIRKLEPGVEQYRSLVGGGSFTDFSDHPANKGWPGIIVGGRKTTAAGAYQIVRTTWNDIGGVSRFGSFDPAAQDAAAIYLIRNRHPNAYMLIESGQIEPALYALRNEWESFDKLLQGNYPYTVADAKESFAAAGGTLA